MGHCALRGDRGDLAAPPVSRLPKSTFGPIPADRNRQVHENRAPFFQRWGYN